MTPHPHLPGRLAGSILSDADASWAVSSSETKYDSPYVSLGIDTIVAPDGTEHGRAVVQPNDAIGILALDEDDRLLLVEQYRHPVRRRLLEIPAGTLDVPGESAPVSYTHLRAHKTVLDLVCRLLLEKKNTS